jgi:hypothetical protein
MKKKKKIKKKIQKKISSIFKSVKSLAPGRENVWFPDSPDFENLPEFWTKRDVR